MDNIKNGLHRLYNHVPFEGDSKLKIREARDLALLMMIYSALNAAIFISAGNLSFALISLLSTGIVTIVFWQTFRAHIRIVFKVLLAWICVQSALCTWVIGKSAGYQNLLYCALLYSLFDPETGLRKKKIFAAAAMIYVVFAIGFADWANQLFYPSGLEKTAADQALALNEVALIMVIIMFCLNYAVNKGESDHQLLLYNARLQDEAGTDPLTGLTNRRGFEMVLERLENEYAQNGIMMTLVMGDIDLFKHINDTYGHDAGDAVLKQLADIMKTFMQTNGYVARWGGEEFLLAFAGMNGDETCGKAEELRQRIEKTAFLYKETQIPVRMTFGVEEYDRALKTAGTIKKADEKLYLGKQQGRNRVVY